MKRGKDICMVRGAKLWEWAKGTKKIIVIERDKGELP